MYAAALILTVILLLFVVVRFSVAPTNFDCITEDDQRVALLINRYRWWVHLWAPSGTDGDARIQSPNLRERIPVLFAGSDK